ncbi:MAG TPA: sigma-70 family RNA polymerase sigma factor [Gaiellaceae bacterium]|nr:sigma-70 family RNA polymerase sigma factor [Gaiellaceae bacterium]
MISASRRGDAAACERLIEQYLPLVKVLARRFANRGEQLDDLVQVATVGLIAAIDRFDLDRDVELHNFAVPTIVGELKNHLRDRASAVRVPRRVHDLAPSVRRRELELSARLERPASVTELATDMGLRECDVREVLAARAARTPLSIADPSLGDAQLFGDDNGADVSEEIDERLVVAASLRMLSRRERCILRLRFVDELTQAEIADVLGISQTHVSRLIRSALAQLRHQLVDGSKQPASSG